MGYLLGRQGLRFVILDAADSVGAAWRTRWESLTLFTPRRYSGLPGQAFPGDPEGYPTRDEVIAYLDRYAQTFDLPIKIPRPRNSGVDREAAEARDSAPTVAAYELHRSGRAVVDLDHTGAGRRARAATLEVFAALLTNDALASVSVFTAPLDSALGVVQHTRPVLRLSDRESGDRGAEPDDREHGHRRTQAVHPLLVESPATFASSSRVSRLAVGSDVDRAWR